MAKEKATRRKTQSSSRSERKARKRTGCGRIARTAMAAGLAFSVSGMAGCEKTGVQAHDAAVVDAGEDGSIYPIMAPPDAGDDSGVSVDAGDDGGIYPIMPPQDGGPWPIMPPSDGGIYPILPVGDGGTATPDGGPMPIMPP
jgi:hypothetical protein